MAEVVQIGQSKQHKISLLKIVDVDFCVQIFRCGSFFFVNFAYSHTGQLLHGLDHQTIERSCDVTAQS